MDSLIKIFMNLLFWFANLFSNKAYNEYKAYRYNDNVTVRRIYTIYLTPLYEVVVDNVAYRCRTFMPPTFLISDWFDKNGNNPSCFIIDNQIRPAFKAMLSIKEHKENFYVSRLW